MVLGLGLGAARARAAEAQDRLAQLEARVTALESQRAANSKEMADTIEEVLRDAERRSFLLAAGADGSAGYDQKGFFLRSGENWELRPSLFFQFRHVVNYRDDVDGDDSRIENGFEVRRMKLFLDGTALTPRLTYRFHLGTNRDTNPATAAAGGSVYLEEVWAKYRFNDDWGMRLGQFKDPVHHEELTSLRRQLAVERSLVNDLIGGTLVDYTQGVSLIYGDYSATNPWNAEVAITDGAGEDNTNFTDKVFDFGLAGRIEHKLTGDWNHYRDFSAKGNKRELAVVGAGGDWSQAGDFNQLLGTVDVQWENAQGLGAYAAMLVRDRNGAGVEDALDWGAVTQAGYVLAPSLEVFARYDFTRFDEDQANGGNLFHEFTVGFNRFLGRHGDAFHRAKITVDLIYLPHGSPKTITGSGILDANDGHGEWVLRTQLQLII